MGLSFGSKTPESIYINNKEVEQIAINNDVVWVKQQQIPDYLYIENISNESGNFNFGSYVNSSSITEYSTDGVNWTSYNFNVRPYISVSPNQKLYLRGTNWVNDGGATNGGTRIHFDKNYNVGGNIMSLVNYNTMNDVTITPADNNGFGSLFYGETNLISAANINFGNVSSIGKSTFYNCFRGCSNLISLPDFSVISTIGQSSFEQCFLNCVSLQTPPDFSNVTSIGTSGLSTCFKNCTSMTQCVNLNKITTIAGDALRNCYEGCTSITTGLDLSKVTKVSLYGCASLYKGCTSLTSVTAPNISTWYQNGMSSWLSGVSASGTVYAPTGVTIPTSASGIPSGWTRQDY